MKIIISSLDQRRTITLKVPMFKAFINLILKKIAKEGNINIDRKTSKKIKKALKEYIKCNGHFDIVNIDSADGDKMTIKV